MDEVEDSQPRRTTKKIEFNPFEENIQKMKRDELEQ